MSQLKNKYKILKEQNLLIVVQEGTLNLESMINLMKILNEEPLFSPKFDQIVDLNEVIFDLSTTDIKTYVYHLESSAKTYGKKRIALITNTPNQVTYSTLFKLAQEELQPLQSVQIFSTTQKAYNFIGIKKISFEEISQTLKELKKELAH